MKTNPSLSLIACCIYQTHGLSLKALKKVLSEYKQKYESTEIDASRLENVLSIGITVRCGENILHYAKRPVKRSVSVEFDSFKKLYSLTKKNAADGYFCRKCKGKYSSTQAFSHHLRLGRCKTPREKAPMLRGGSFPKDAARNLWNRLAGEGVTVDKSLRFPLHFAVFDFECRFENACIPPTKYSRYDKELILVSYSLHSNVLPNEKFFFANADPENVFTSFINLCQRLSQKASKFQTSRFKNVFSKINERICYIEHLMQSDAHCTDTVKQCGYFTKLKDLNSLRTSLEQYITLFPVIGFNSSGFDLPLVKQYLCKLLSTSETGKQDFVIKNGNKFKCVQYGNVRFLDVLNYVAPGYSLRQFLKAHLPEIDPAKLKGIFCYEWLDSYKKLSSTKFPPMCAFNSSLRGTNISKDDYEEALAVWKSLPEPRTMLGYLEWYNNLDVEYLLTACERLQQFWCGMVGKHPFRQAVSLPSLALSLAASRMSPTAHILLPTKKSSSALTLIKKAIVGGPAIVFLRYSAAGETLIKQHKYGAFARPVKSIVTFDLNSLYIYAMTKCLMPCGNWTHFAPVADSKERFVGRKMVCFYREELEWLLYRQELDGSDGSCKEHKIIHQWNGGPFMLGHWSVDGFCAACRRVYCYDGVHFHGPCAECPPRRYNDYEEQQDDFLKRSEHEFKRNRQKVLHPHLTFVEICSHSWSTMKSSSSELRAACLRLFPREIQQKLNTEKDRILADVRSGRFFGILEVQIQVPDDLIEKYDIFPPFFCHKELNVDLLPSRVQEMAEDFNKDRKSKKLLSTLETDHFSVISPLLKYYMELGFVVGHLYDAVAFTGMDAFSRLGEEIHNLRCQAESQPDLAIKAQTMKLAGNSIYGKTCENKAKYADVSYVQNQDIQPYLESKLLKSFEELPGNVMEVHKLKGKAVEDMPRAVGAFILGYAKLQMLKFVYALLDFCSDADWSPIVMDTDSLCMELSVPGGDIDAIIKPEKRQEWAKVRHKFFPVSNDPREQRRHGIFKVEFLGTHAVALAAKCYCLKNEETGQEKSASKGVSKTQNDLSFEQYKKTLFSVSQMLGQNRGFRKTTDGRMLQYTQEKIALSSYYDKRLLSDNLIDTSTIRFLDDRV